MEMTVKWNHKMAFTAEAGNLRVEMDAKPPIGEGVAMTPKQLLLAGIAGCTAMDVVALLKKYRQPADSLTVDVSAETTENQHPAVFKSVQLIFRAAGNSVTADKLTEAVRASQTKFCGVSAMVSKVVPIRYVIELNGNEIGSGEAKFWE